MTTASREIRFEWFVADRYKVRTGRIYADEQNWEPYYPGDVVDLPGKFTEVLQGERAVQQFVSRYGFMGYGRDFIFTVQDYMRGNEVTRSFENWIEDVGTRGEDISSIYADARTVLAIKYAGAFLQEPDAMRQVWRRFIRERGNDVITYGQERYSQLTEIPVSAEIIRPGRENLLFHRDVLEEVKARAVIAILLEGNLKRGLFPKFRVHADGKPEMNLQFESLIHFIYWRLFEEMSSSLTKICPCGKIFQTQNALQRHHDAQCTNRMNQRRFRQRNRGDRQK